MIRAWIYLNEQDRTTLRLTIAFLGNRLAEQATIDWALRLKPTQRIERFAIEELLNSPEGRVIAEPWATAWRLIEESWSFPSIEQGPSTTIHGIQARLRAGERSGAIISSIVGLVAPRLKVEPINSRWQLMKKPRRPKTFKHLLSAELTSGDLVDLATLELPALTDTAFLKALGSALESAVNHGLEMARRLGWDGQRRLWQLGDLGRVYYVPTTPMASGGNDPDVFHHGIAPSVKLLYAVVERITELNTAEALTFVQRWRLIQSPIYVRLWAAMARNAQLVDPTQVDAFLVDLNDHYFWVLDEFPEITELRASRFGDLGTQAQRLIAKRVRKGPPRNFWPRNAESEKIKNARLYWTVRELKRIEVAGGILLPNEQAFMDANIDQYDDLASMNVDYAFPEGFEAYAIPPRPDPIYNTLSGPARLHALETALSVSNGGWYDGASDWLQQPETSLLVLNDIEVTGNSGNEFPGIWNHLGWVHSPIKPDASQAPGRYLQGESDRVLELLDRLSTDTLFAAIDGISAWLYSWKKQIIASTLGLSIWLRIWPIAVEATNSTLDNTDNDSATITTQDDGKPEDLDTLNTPAGKLVGVFLAACPSLEEVPNPFGTDSHIREWRDTVINACGHSGLIAQYRLIEALPYFLRADQGWAEQHLVTPLLNDDGTSLPLWRAIARQIHSTEVLKIIGRAMADRATDRRLGRETRQRLVFSLVTESLHAFREGRKPAVPNPSIQQMLRILDDEVRASAVNAVQRFVRKPLTVKAGDDKTPPSSADLFRSAAMPFLRQVWPQERSLATPGVSGAFAELPSTAGEAFAEAVDSIERFLVPFQCWSMLDYGIEFKADNPSIIDNETKAEALLRLLNLTIGSSEGAVVPYDLTDALDQIRSVEPELSKNPMYQRLSTAARR